MSEVISFRLDRSNPREARAREVLRAWIGQGYSVRHILTEALLKLDEGAVQETELLLEALNETLSRLEHLVEQMQDGHYATPPGGRAQTRAALPDTFVAAVTKAAKPGLKLG